MHLFKALSTSFRPDFSSLVFRQLKKKKKVNLFPSDSEPIKKPRTKSLFKKSKIVEKLPKNDEILLNLFNKSSPKLTP